MKVTRIRAGEARRRAQLGSEAASGRRAVRTTVNCDDPRVPQDVANAISDVIGRAAAEFGVTRGEVSVRLIDAGEMRQLNSRWRGKERATDVLSFPSAAITNLPAKEARSHLGDIAICLEVAQGQADEQGHSLVREASLLALHGFLHLLGYDHETDDGEMESIEAKLRQQLVSHE